MPIAAVAGAAIAIGVAAEVGTAFAVIAAVGATVGAIGAVTGNQTLGIIGGVIGAIGGIGALASGAGLIPSFEEMTGIGSSSNIAAGAAPGAGSVNPDMEGQAFQMQQAMGTSGPGAATPPAAVPAVNTTPDIVNKMTGAVDTNLINPDTGLKMNPGDAPGQGPLAGANPLGPTGGGNMQAQSALSSDTKISDLQASPLTAPPAASDAPVVTPTQQAAASPSAGGGSLGTLAGNVKPPLSIWDKLKEGLTSPTALAGVIQAGGAFISGATNTLTPAQIGAYEAVAKQNVAAAGLANAQTDMVKQQLTNMNTPLPAFTGPTSGIINQGPRRTLSPPTAPPPVSSSPVTGTV